MRAPECLPVVRRRPSSRFRRRNGTVRSSRGRGRSTLEMRDAQCRFMRLSLNRRAFTAKMGANDLLRASERVNVMNYRRSGAGRLARGLAGVGASVIDPRGPGDRRAGWSNRRAAKRVGRLHLRVRARAHSRAGGSVPPGEPRARGSRGAPDVRLLSAGRHGLPGHVHRELRGPRPDTREPRLELQHAERRRPSWLGLRAPQLRRADHRRAHLRGRRRSRRIDARRRARHEHAASGAALELRHPHAPRAAASPGTCT